MAAALPDTPDATSNAKEASRAAVAGVNVQLPATVVSFDADTQTATVRIVPMFRRRDPNDKAATVAYEPPDLPGVPVAYPGTGGFSIYWPLEAGDSGRVVFCDRSIDEWKSEGGARTEPQDMRRHDLTDAIFVPDLRSPADPLPAEARHATAMVIRADDLRLGSSAATDFVALASLVAANLSALETAIVAAVSAAIAGKVAGDGGLAAFTAFQTSIDAFFLAWPTNVAATKVRAE